MQISLPNVLQKLRTEGTEFLFQRIRLRLCPFLRVFQEFLESSLVLARVFVGSRRSELLDVSHQRRFRVQVLREHKGHKVKLGESGGLLRLSARLVLQTLAAFTPRFSNE